ncbi:MAG: MBL fold metallo-hydrolase, partial [Chloroflexota bacterium]
MPPTPSDHPLRIIPLGGVGEIGKNMYVFEYRDEIVVIDCGLMFPDEEMFGIDLVIPDITYLKERRANVKAFLITHAHEDHVGALPYVLPEFPGVPVYASTLARGLLGNKIKEHKLHNNPLIALEPGEEIDIGAFHVMPFRVGHSIPDAMGIALRTPVGTVVHTGDFKFDHTPVDGKLSDFAILAR